MDYGRADRRAAVTSVDKMLFYDVSVVDYDNDCAKEFGRVRMDLRRQGIEIPTVDLMIASVALVYDLTMITHDTADYQNISGLRLDDWLQP